MRTSVQFFLFPLAALSACSNEGAGGTKEIPETPGSSGSTSPTSSDGPDHPTTSDPGASTGDPTTGEAATTGETSSAEASSAETSSAGSTSADAAVCGDGVIEGEEQCDNGWSQNSDDHLCTSECQDARCGDGHVQPASGEACDDGDGYNFPDPGYDQCSTLCTPGPYCGDGVVQPEHGEECEGDPDDETNTCAVNCVHMPRFIFLSSVPVSGDAGGVAGADLLCNELAAARPGVVGTFRAWLLVDGQTLLDRFPEYSGPKAVWNFRDMGGTLLAKSFEELVQLGPAGPIVRSEQGFDLPEQFVWTNITKSGEAAGGDCGQWTSEVGASALIGLSGFVPDVGPEAQLWHAERRWTDLSGIQWTCENTAHLYCVQVGN